MKKYEKSSSLLIDKFTNVNYYKQYNKIHIFEWKGGAYGRKVLNGRKRRNE